MSNKPSTIQSKCLQFHQLTYYVLAYINVKIIQKYKHIDMNRARKRRVNSQSDLLESGSHPPGSIFNLSSAPVRYMEDINYKMDEGDESTSSNYVMMQNKNLQSELRTAFKKKKPLKQLRLMLIKTVNIYNTMWMIISTSPQSSPFQLKIQEFSLYLLITYSQLHQTQILFQNNYNSLLIEEIMLSRVQPLQKSQIYIKKKAKSPDHLYNLLQKNKSRQQASLIDEDQEQKDKIKRQIMQKRIDLILKSDTRKPKVSQPVPFVKRKWVAPLAQLTQNKQIDSFTQMKPVQVKYVRQNKEQVQKVVKILDINKTLRYFGEYLQVSYNTEKMVQVAKLTEKQSKLNYVSQKFNQMIKKQRPKLCITNFTTQKQVTFINYLQEDKFYQNIIRKNDNQLIRILIEALQVNGKFTMVSYLRFYEIFVWQSADRSEQIQFVLKLLMSQCNQRSIVQLSKKIDTICKKIFIQNFNKSLQNFNQIMKKLLFGDDYEYSNQNEYHMTRKALTESLQRNEECISIFVNIFYAS